MACRLWPRGISFSVGLILSDQYHRLRFTDTFAFGAKRLISHHVATWMMAYVDQAIVSGQPSGDALGSLLYSSAVGKHTSIVHLNRVDGAVKLVRYVWEHKFQRPNTHSFPIACPQCWHIYSWSKIGTAVPDDGSAFILKCTTKLANGGRCPGTWEVPALPTSSIVRLLYVGTWRIV